MVRIPYSRTLCNFILLLAMLSLTVAFAPLRNSQGQSPQDNRQLQRDSSRKLASERRTALVIGNGAYTNAPPLKNPPNDATLVAATLKDLGFEVTVATNRSQREMKQLIRDFGQRLLAVGGVGLFYFAGHGVQSKGHNYLIPIEGDIQTEADIEDVGVDVNYVLNLIDDAQSSLNIVILDACRNNPFARSFRSAQSGLAQVRAPSGTLIAYATAPDSTAADGDKANSPYTEELTKQMETPGLVLETMFRRVTEQVSSRTSGRQEPWVSDNHKGEFYFRDASADSDTSTVPTSISDASKEQALWEAVKDSNDVQDFRDYLAKYPKGAYVDAANIRLKRLGIASQKKTSSAEPAVNDATSKINKGAETVKSGSLVKNQMGMAFVYVPPGKFMMGSTDEGLQRAFEDARRQNTDARLEWFKAERPQHPVTIIEGFYIGQYEVTRAQWMAVTGKKPSLSNDCDQCPMDDVSWDDAEDFIRKMNALNDGYNYRLPTEAEWEYACRAGTTGDYYADLDSIAWYYANAGDEPLSGLWNLEKLNANKNRTHPVGQKQPNRFGLFDTAGNVWEVCEDVWHDSYKGAPPDGSAWITGGKAKEHVIRGGAYQDTAYSLRSSSRSKLMPRSTFGKDASFIRFLVGIRIVAVPRT